MRDRQIRVQGEGHKKYNMLTGEDLVTRLAVEQQVDMWCSDIVMKTVEMQLLHSADYSSFSPNTFNAVIEQICVHLGDLHKRLVDELGHGGIAFTFDLTASRRMLRDGFQGIIADGTGQNKPVLNKREEDGDDGDRDDDMAKWRNCGNRQTTSRSPRAKRCI